MKKIVTLVLVGIMIFTATSLLQAQPRTEKQRPARKEAKQKERKTISPEKRAAFMAKQLELTEAETADLQNLFEKQEAKIKLKREDMKKKRAEQKAIFESERKAQNAALIEIIGHDKFQKLQNQRIARLERENKMMKMRLMHRENPSVRRRILMEKKNKARAINND